jgi:parallel beta-helix repeat protein
MVYSTTGDDVTNIAIVGNTISNTNKMGIYVQSAVGYTITGNVLYKCDQLSTGLDTLPPGAISVNNGSDPADGRQGTGSITGNVIIDAGYCGIYLNIYANTAETTVTGNTIIFTAPAQSTVGVVAIGKYASVTSNIFRGCTNALFILTNNTDDYTGHIAFHGNICQAGNATGTVQHVNRSSANFITAISIVGNTFLEGSVAVNLYARDLTLGQNITRSVTTTQYVMQADRATVTGNSADGGSVGIQAVCRSGNANARILITGNSFSACTAPYSLTWNTGRIVLTGNDVGVIPGMSANVGDASKSIAPTCNAIQWWGSELTANRTATLSSTRAYPGAIVEILRNAATPGAFTLAVVDGPSTNTLYTFASDTNGSARFLYNGTNWVLLGTAGLS